MVTDKNRIESLAQELATVKMKHAEAMTMLAWYDAIASKVPLNWGKLKVIGLEQWVDRMLTHPQSPQEMTWTTERPTHTGWYWYRGAHFIEQNALVQIVPKEGGQESTVEMWHIASEAGLPVPDGEWAGPLKPPQ
jgi:hypothetical protein